jgi:hypothetical protein
MNTVLFFCSVPPASHFLPLPFLVRPLFSFFSTGLDWFAKGMENKIHGPFEQFGYDFWNQGFRLLSPIPITPLTRKWYPEESGTWCFDSFTIGMPNLGQQLHPEKLIPDFISVIRSKSAELHSMLARIEMGKNNNPTAAGLTDVPIYEDYLRQIRQRFSELSPDNQFMRNWADKFVYSTPTMPVIGLISRHSRRKILNEEEMIDAVKDIALVVPLHLEGLFFHEQVRSFVLLLSFSFLSILCCSVLSSELVPFCWCYTFPPFFPFRLC